MTNRPLIADNFSGVFTNGHLSTIADRATPFAKVGTILSHCSRIHLPPLNEWIDSCEQRQ
jgi:hypothetical protein